MIQQFPCKEPNCPEKVEFEYKPVTAVTKMAKTPGEIEVIAHLTCNKGHTHPYKVKVPK